MLSREWSGVGKVAIVCLAGDSSSDAGSNINTSNDVALQTSLWLAERGALVVLAGPCMQRLQACTAAICAQATDASGRPAAVQLRSMQCDLSSLASVQRFAIEFGRLGLQLDLLVCNTQTAEEGRRQRSFRRTVDGFEHAVSRPARYELHCGRAFINSNAVIDACVVSHLCCLSVCLLAGCILRCRWARDTSGLSV